jgi:hypothetical protein
VAAAVAAVAAAASVAAMAVLAGRGLRVNLIARRCARQRATRAVPFGKSEKSQRVGAWLRSRGCGPRFAAPARRVVYDISNPILGTKGRSGASTLASRSRSTRGRPRRFGHLEAALATGALNPSLNLLGSSDSYVLRGPLASRSPGPAPSEGPLTQSTGPKHLGEERTFEGGGFNVRLQRRAQQ